MHLFEALIVLHVITGATGLIAFWVPIATRKGAQSHRKWGRIACYAFMGAGALAAAMAMLSLYAPEGRHPTITDRTVFEGLFVWMMLFLGLLTIGFADYGLSVVRHARDRLALRGARYQAVMISVILSALWCGYFGVQIGNALMIAVAFLGVTAMALQQKFIWQRADPGPKDYVDEHFRALIGMGISAYTAFMSVGLIRWVPEEVFNPLIWAGPSIVGVSLIIGFTLQIKRKQRSKIAPHSNPSI